MSHAARTHFGRADARLRRQLAALVKPRRSLSLGQLMMRPLRQAEAILTAAAFRDIVAGRLRG